MWRATELPLIDPVSRNTSTYEDRVLQIFSSLVTFQLAGHNTKLHQSYPWKGAMGILRPNMRAASSLAVDHPAVFYDNDVLQQMRYIEAPESVTLFCAVFLWR